MGFYCQRGYPLTLQSEQSVYLRDMLIEKRYHQKYLLARIVGSPFTTQATNCIISDPQGSAMILEPYDHALYPISLRGHAGNVDPDQVDYAKVWREGRYMLIKEPKLSQMYEGRGKFCIVAWSGTDIVWLEDDDPLVTGVEWLDARRVVYMDDEEEGKKAKKGTKTLQQRKDEGNKVSSTAISPPSCQGD